MVEIDERASEHGTTRRERESLTETARRERLCRYSRKADVSPLGGGERDKTLERRVADLVHAELLPVDSNPHLRKTGDAEHDGCVV